jgi:hypothetical protein
MIPSTRAKGRARLGRAEFRPRLRANRVSQKLVKPLYFSVMTPNNDGEETLARFGNCADSAAALGLLPVRESSVPRLFRSIRHQCDIGS